MPSRQGLDGLDGLDGLSAFEIAKAKGFTGTVEEWLESLRGEPGRRGKDGIDGRDGKDGKDGEHGLAPGPEAIEKMIADAVAKLPPAHIVREVAVAPAPVAPEPAEKVWSASFIRDAKTKLTTLVLAGPVCTSTPKLSLKPSRTSDDLIDTVEILFL